MIAEDIHEVSVASKVADDSAVPDGVVDGAVRIWKKNWMGRGSSIGDKLVADS